MRTVSPRTFLHTARLARASALRSSRRAFASPDPGSRFPACGRPRVPPRATVVASSPSRDAAMAASLPRGEGADALVARSCADLGACSRDTPRLTPEEIETHMRAVPTWRLDEGATKIVRAFTAKNWQCAVDFVNALSAVAEAEGHHPDVAIKNYREVEVVASTHAIGGLSLHDFVLAAKLDAVDVVYSPKWLREQTQKDEARE
jgi:4a-hydroxytetrahydrobiopterin dehydratase